jgi:hypothetical protein
MGGLALGAVSAVLLRLYLQQENRRRDRLELATEANYKDASQAVKEDKTDQDMLIFRYLL